MYGSSHDCSSSIDETSFPRYEQACDVAELSPAAVPEGFPLLKHVSSLALEWHRQPLCLSRG